MNLRLGLMGILVACYANVGICLAGSDVEKSLSIDDSADPAKCRHYARMVRNLSEGQLMHMDSTSIRGRCRRGDSAEVGSWATERT